MQNVWNKSDRLICENALHIWRIPVRQLTHQIPIFLKYLDRAEKKRAKQFHFEKDRDLFIVSHGALRVILAHYLFIKPGKLSFFEQNGKPFLNDYPSLQFNLSHSQDYALISVLQDSPIGVDIEYMRSMENRDEIVKRFFSPRELKEFESLDETEKQLGFYQGWTRKEAFLKTTTQGIFRGLHNFEVTLSPNEPTRLLSITGSAKKAQSWRIRNLELVENYCAAVAWQGPEKKFFFFDYIDHFDKDAKSS